MQQVVHQLLQLLQHLQTNFSLFQNNPGNISRVFLPLNIIMSFKITCYTLFDITQTGVMNRSKPPESEDFDSWLLKRNTQCNFDTILQAISLRSQPEITKSPQKINIRFDQFTHFGFLYTQSEDELYPCWTFEFEVQHPSVFEDGKNELGALYRDCDEIPMIKCGTEWDKLQSYLDTTPELRNIFFQRNYE